jgi:hypothetical protein
MPLFGANVESSRPFPDTCNPLMVLGLPDVDSVSTPFYTQSSTWLREATHQPNSAQGLPIASPTRMGIQVSELL